MAELLEWGEAHAGVLSEGVLLIPGAARYAGEDSKTGNEVIFANTDCGWSSFSPTWLPECFAIDERLLGPHICLHRGLDLDAATALWSAVTDVPPGQFRAPYLTVGDPTYESNKQEHGCISVVCPCSRTHRAVLGLVHALLRSSFLPG